MLVLSANDIDTLVTSKEAVDAMEEAFRVQESGSFTMPDRMHTDHKTNTLLLMPAITDKTLSTKIISIFPGNTKNRLPVIQGCLILSSGTTGEPLAIINGARLTSLRTGAVGGVALRWLARKPVKNVGIIGTGVQGQELACFACSELNPGHLFVHDTKKNTMDLMENIVYQKYPNIKFVKISNPDLLPSKCEVLITATTSVNPVFNATPAMLSDMLLVGIGSFKPEMQEFPDVVCESANQVFIDTPHAVHESGDLVKPLARGLIASSSIFTLGKLIVGEVQLSELEGPRLFKSVGMALFDLFMANLLFQKALQSNIGVKVNL